MDQYLTGHEQLTFGVKRNQIAPVVIGDVTPVDSATVDDAFLIGGRIGRGCADYDPETMEKERS